ncbi:hypothetical protein VUJ49_09070 [Pseudomonas berkeleyensis]|uniref:Uncharacterized protein n=1 Tax=Pseudomonas berkeleyensis TaxID=2726956 RepID=A0A7G5DTW2_9PSED|nr:hypothetical protein [Pseudomonas berkeleyensis]QMV65187.1 hypothetical protein HS968_09035 [Pseudomonas berkeleyensis]WSO40660.1 hypothetical protein VUJ49_09070 [Pseudomonas berkeleyensis]
MQLIATRVTDFLAGQLRQIDAANGYPLTLAGVHVGQFYEDLAAGDPLPLGTLVAASTSDAVTPNGVVSSSLRGRAYQVEVVVNFDQHPGVERHVLLDQIEWSIGRAVRERPPPELRGVLQSVALGDVQFNYPAPSHSLAIVQAQVNAVFVEQYQP